jgi:RNA polymerase sigma-70 factor (sigma-E family)
MENDFRDYVASRQRALLRTAWLLTGDWGRAEDLVQTALAKAWPHWSRVSRDGGADAYVHRVLVNTWRSGWRRRWSGEIPTGALPDAVVAPGSTELRILLVDLVRSLPARQRAVIALRYLTDLPEASVAEAMGCSVGTVKSQTSKALASLRAHPQLAHLTFEELR